MTHPVEESLPFAGRVAVVTGGARGIGLATVRALLAGGARVCVADLDVDHLPDYLEAGWRDAVLAMACDLAEPGAAARVVEATEAHFGCPDILVNNAGYYWDAPIHRMTDDQFDAMLQIHTVVPFRLMRETLQRWRPLAKAEGTAPAAHRKIVNVSSRAAFRGLAGAANYAAGKAGLLGLTYSAARECARLRIDVNAVAFGPVSTRFGLAVDAGNVVRSGGREVPLGRKVVEGPPAAGPMRPVSPRRATMSGRAATAAEAADSIVFLCSQQSNMVNGEVINVNS